MNSQPVGLGVVENNRLRVDLNLKAPNGPDHVGPTEEENHKQFKTICASKTNVLFGTLSKKTNVYSGSLTLFALYVYWTNLPFNFLEKISYQDRYKKITH